MELFNDYNSDLGTLPILLTLDKVPHTTHTAIKQQY